MLIKRKGISSRQLHRAQDVSYKIAWFVSHRVLALSSAASAAVHLCEHVRGNMHANTIEGVLLAFKHDLKCVRQHCSSEYLQRFARHWKSVIMSAQLPPQKASRASA